MSRFRYVASLLPIVLASGGCVFDGEGRSEQRTGMFTLDPVELGYVLRSPGGQPVFRYTTKRPADTILSVESACFFHPVFTPAGTTVTELAPADHKHHRGVFLGWYSMKGDSEGDFWGWGEHAPLDGRVIVNRRVEQSATPSGSHVTTISNDWQADDQVMLSETLDVETWQENNANVMQLSYRLSPRQDIHMDQGAFGGFCYRAAMSEDVTITDPSGEVAHEQPHYLQPETNWPDAAWYDLTGTADNGLRAGVAVINHADNPPTRWFNHGPLRMLNPCIISHGDVTLRLGEPIVLKYLLVVHDGPAPSELLNKLAAQWAGR